MYSSCNVRPSCPRRARHPPPSDDPYNLPDSYWHRPPRAESSSDPWPAQEAAGCSGMHGPEVRKSWSSWSSTPLRFELQP